MKMFFISVLLFCNTLLTASSTRHSATGLLFEQIQNDNPTKLEAAFKNTGIDIHNLREVAFEEDRIAYLSLATFAVWTNKENCLTILHILQKKGVPLHTRVTIFDTTGKPIPELETDTLCIAKEKSNEKIHSFLLSQQRTAHKKMQDLK